MTLTWYLTRDATLDTLGSRHWCCSWNTLGSFHPLLRRVLRRQQPCDRDAMLPQYRRLPPLWRTSTWTLVVQVSLTIWSVMEVAAVLVLIVYLKTITFSVAFY